MPKEEPNYTNIVDGKEVEEKDKAFQDRIGNLPNLSKVVRIIKDNSDYSVVSHSKLHRTLGKIILKKNGHEVSLLLRYMMNSGETKNPNKRWQVYRDLVYADLKNIYLLGVYSTGDSYLFTLSDDESFVGNYSKGEDAEHANYSSSWFGYDILKNCALIKNNTEIGIRFDKKKGKSHGRMRIAFHESYFDNALDTIVSAKFKGVDENHVTDFKVKDTYTILPVELVRNNGFLEKSDNIKRNPLFVKMALFNADHKCEINSEHSSFKKANGVMYTEGHHLLPVNNSAQMNFSYSLDHPDNIFSLCPNCHRKIHHASMKEIKEMIDKLFSKREEFYSETYRTTCNAIYQYY